MEGAFAACECCSSNALLDKTRTKMPGSLQSVEKADATEVYKAMKVMNKMNAEPLFTQPCILEWKKIDKPGRRSVDHREQWTCELGVETYKFKEDLTCGQQVRRKRFQG